MKLKSNIHQIVDKIQSEQLLQTIYDFLKSSEEKNNGAVWASLTEEQRHEVLTAFEESEEEENLIAKEKAFDKTK